jgi:hypothetical protein
MTQTWHGTTCSERRRAAPCGMPDREDEYLAGGIAHLEVDVVSTARHEEASDLSVVQGPVDSGAQGSQRDPSRCRAKLGTEQVTSSGSIRQPPALDGAKVTRALAVRATE